MLWLIGAVVNAAILAAPLPDLVWINAAAAVLAMGIFVDWSIKRAIGGDDGTS